MRRTRKQLAPCLAACAVMCSGNAVAQVHQPLEVQRARNLVVEITSKWRQHSIRGAGIVIGGLGDDIFVATARHVVSDEMTGRDNDSILVSFHFEPGISHAASVRAKSESNRDMAIVSVPGVGTRYRWMMMPMYRRGAASGLRPGMRLFLLGCPERGPCGEPSFDPVSVRSLGEGEIALAVQNLAQGYSGGAVCTEDGSVVGMVRGTPDILEGHAIPIDTILDFARRDTIPLRLDPPRSLLAGSPAYSTLDATVLSQAAVELFGALHLRLSGHTDRSWEAGYALMIRPSLRLQAATETFERRLRLLLGEGSAYREARFEAAISMLAPVAVYRRKSDGGYYVGEQALTDSAGNYTFDAGSATWHPVTVGTRVVSAGGMLQVRALLAQGSERRLPYSFGLVARYLWVPRAGVSTWFIGLSAGVPQ